MNFYKIFSKLTILLILLSLNFQIKAKNLTQKDITEIEKFSEEAIDFFNVTGCAFAIFSDKEILLKKTKGIRKIGKNEKINSKTIFRIASLSKILTCMLVMKLYSENKIDIEENINNILYDVTIANDLISKHIKIKHLLNHSSGILKYCLEHEAYINQPFKKLIKNLKLAKKISIPGKSFQYQNVLFSLIKPIIERTLNKDL
ncbi:MAG: beta-lactamase family protein [Bacteroidetes bacterium]|nr:beta-lactamase family protein [Bacteroidota bacterium]